MSRYLIENCTLFDGVAAELMQGAHVLVAEGRIAAISGAPIEAGECERIDASGHCLMPGLIDCHAHVLALSNIYRETAETPDFLAAIKCLPIARGMLHRGFTTVRDGGGADWMLASAIEAGQVEGPRLFVSGKGISQTGGHGDFRGRSSLLSDEACGRRIASAARLADGVEAVRKAAREELQRGAAQVKIMASGGVATPTDPITWNQYSMDELRAAVEEAENAETYVMAHAYAPRSIRRAMEAGVRTVEHVNLIDEDTAEEMARRGVFAVPTLAVYDAAVRYGIKAGRAPESVKRSAWARETGVEALRHLKRAGVKMGFGSDLSGSWHDLQCTEFAIRAEVLEPIDLLRSATSVGAEIVRMENRLGRVKEGFIADLIAVAGNPLEDIGILDRRAGETLGLIMKDGRIVKNALPSARQSEVRKS